MNDKTNVKRINCINDKCGTFVLDRALYDRYQRTNETFHCPAGHAQHFSKESRETKFEKRIKELEREVKQLKKARKRASDSAKEYWEETRELKDKLQAARKRIASGNDGVVEVGDEAYMWACECGNTGQAAFDTERKAWNGYDSHRENSCDLGPTDHSEVPAQ